MRPAIGIVVITLVLAGSLSAQTWYVKPDGNGDQPTIQAAVWAAASGDTVLLANGTFTGDGNRDIDIFSSSVTVRSEAGDPSYCTIECGGSASEPHIAFDIRFGGSPPVTVEGITIINGYGPSGGALYIAMYAAQPCTTVVRNCLFQDNTGEWTGGAIEVTDDCSLILGDCVFVDNSARSGGAVHLLSNGSLAADSCDFVENLASQTCGGAICANNSACAVHGCGFVSNSAAGGGGAIYSTGGGVLGLSNCSFVTNSTPYVGGAVYVNGTDLGMTACVSRGNHCGPDGGGGSVNCSGEATASFISCTFAADSLGDGALRFGPGMSPTFYATVIAFAKDAAAIFCYPPAGTPLLYWCDIYGNELGDYTGCIASQSGLNYNLSQDPRFCDIPSGNLSYEDCSPCLGANNPSTYDIGAVAYAGCACGEATVPTTWGAIKALYR